MLLFDFGFMDLAFLDLELEDAGLLMLNLKFWIWDLWICYLGIWNLIHFQCLELELQDLGFVVWIPRFGIFGFGGVDVGLLHCQALDVIVAG